VADVFTGEAIATVGVAVVAAIIAIARSEFNAREARRETEQLRADLQLARQEMTTQASSIQTVREDLLRSYVDKNTLRQMEDRLSAEIENAANSTAQQINRLYDLFQRAWNHTALGGRGKPHAPE
jgi:hypothetical protein